MDHLLREVNEDLRRERIQHLWRSFGRYTIYITLGTILLTAGFVIWRSNEQAKLQRWTDILIKSQELVDDEDYKSAIALLERSTPSMEGEMQSVAQLWLMQLYLNIGATTKTKELLTSSLMSTPNKTYSDFAYILSPIKRNAPSSQSSFYVLQQEKYALDLLQEHKKIDAIAALRTLEQGLEMPASIHTRINLLLLDLEGNTTTKKPVSVRNLSVKSAPVTPPAP